MAGIYKSLEGAMPLPQRFFNLLLWVLSSPDLRDFENLGGLNVLSFRAEREISSMPKRRFLLVRPIYRVKLYITRNLFNGDIQINTFLIYYPYVNKSH